MKGFSKNETKWGGNTVKSVEICNGVTSIGNRAFNGCNFFKAITIPDGVTLGNNVFGTCMFYKDEKTRLDNSEIANSTFEGNVIEMVKIKDTENKTDQTSKDLPMMYIVAIAVALIVVAGAFLLWKRRT